MSENGLSRELIEGTLADLTEVIAGLEIECAQLDERLSETKKRCVQWERHLKKFDANGQRRTRAKKGENEAKIASVFRENPSLGFTMPELAKLTGISWSSIRNVLTRKQSEKYREIDGRYYDARAVMGCE